jgi:hypothetical protein
VSLPAMLTVRNIADRDYAPVAIGSSSCTIAEDRQFRRTVNSIAMVTVTVVSSDYHYVRNIGGRVCNAWETSPGSDYLK